MSRFVIEWQRTAERAHEISRLHGFWENERNDGEAIALCHSELSEALEAMRHGNPRSKAIPSHSQVTEELADLVIRVMDLSHARGWLVGDAVVAKMAVNETRPHKHDKEF